MLQRYYLIENYGLGDLRRTRQNSNSKHPTPIIHHGAQHPARGASMLLLIGSRANVPIRTRTGCLEGWTVGGLDLSTHLSLCVRPSLPFIPPRSPLASSRATSRAPLSLYPSSVPPLCLLSAFSVPSLCLLCASSVPAGRRRPGYRNIQLQNVSDIWLIVVHASHLFVIGLVSRQCQGREHERRGRRIRSPKLRHEVCPISLRAGA